MSDADTNSREELPIERGFPIEQVNDLADREGRAKLYYRPLSTMHKWWARQLGSVFRAVSLYSLVNEPAAVNVCEPGQDEYDLSDFGGGDTDSGDTTADLGQLIESVSLTHPDALWDLYRSDVRIDGKKSSTRSWVAERVS